MAHPFFPAFLADEPGATALLPPRFRDPAARIARARHLAGRGLPRTLLEAIADQQATLPPSAARQAALETLAGRAAVVVTGQQAGLFGGPLYSLYKACTAIAAARALTVEAGVPVVPIFWVQSEDHDLAEIDHTFLPPAPGSRAPVELRLVHTRGADRAAVAHRELDDEVEPLLDRLAAALAGLPHAAPTVAALRDAYRPGRSLPAAFAAWIAGIFDEEGLLVVDPRDPRLAALGRPVLRAAITDHDGLTAALVERAAAITAAGFTVQVPIRPEALLLFHHPDGVAGPRRRPHRGDDAALLLAELERDPLRFSTSALLRPLLQDALLPTVMYVGGPGEIAYFAELPPLYARLALPEPVVLPRARVRLVEADRGRRPAPLPPGLPEPGTLEDRLAQAAAAELAAVEGAAELLDPELARAVRRTRETIARAGARLSARYRRALAARTPGSCLDPEGEPQERRYGLPWFAARVGLAELKRKLFAAIDPFAAASYEIEL